MLASIPPASLGRVKRSPTFSSLHPYLSTGASDQCTAKVPSALDIRLLPASICYRGHDYQRRMIKESDEHYVTYARSARSIGPRVPHRSCRDEWP